VFLPLISYDGNKNRRPELRGDIVRHIQGGDHIHAFYLNQDVHNPNRVGYLGLEFFQTKLIDLYVYGPVFYLHHAEVPAVDLTVS
jgi:hypothetical protein